ncbi:hypothetical protein [Pseudalkalibacillus caeni]|uniref:Uncharacterized protein n=1 Tax=Exobacillus caeni TaxID=2574798 RepID=A0A5R9F122_9BACL|nr:hypothetical protein [Pseudalkalibacillus caeni]TLS35128.1 hypothetical protein FCL54_21990 [Pseudalkalibacillus caeni]
MTKRTAERYGSKLRFSRARAELPLTQRTPVWLRLTETSGFSLPPCDKATSTLFLCSLSCALMFHIFENLQLIEAKGSRLLREKQQLKIPQEAFFADEEAEALPAESELPGAEINVEIASEFIPNVKFLKLRKEPKKKNEKKSNGFFFGGRA